MESFVRSLNILWLVGYLSLLRQDEVDSLNYRIARSERMSTRKVPPNQKILILRYSGTAVGTRLSGLCGVNTRVRGTAAVAHRRRHCHGITSQTKNSLKFKTVTRDAISIN